MTGKPIAPAKQAITQRGQEPFALDTRRNPPPP
jgi:hypothetical protein